MRIIAGKYKNSLLKAPIGNTTRPTSSRLRGAVFNILMQHIEGARFLDLFAGSGSMGLEALSRGAAFATFVEENRDSARVIQENITSLGVKHQTMVLCGDCAQQLPRLAQLEAPYSIIYVDPPYETPITNTVLEAIDNSSILESGGLLFLEESKRFEVPQLATLKFKKSRSVGRSTLYEFVRAI